MHPKPGDVLVSNELATTDYLVSIVPTPSRFHGTHDDAIATACELAEHLRVDVWLTEDRTHFKQVASYRPEARVPRR